MPVSATTLARTVVGAAVPLPNVLSTRHLDRIAGGLLYAPTSSVSWATLLARTFDVDVKACPRCGGRLEVRAVVSDPHIARKILDSIPRAARAPPPTELTSSIEPPRRIVYAQQFVDAHERPAPAPGTESWPATLRTTVLLAEEAPDRTRVTLTIEPHGEATSPEIAAFVRERSEMTVVWTGSFDALEARLEAPAASTPRGGALRPPGSP